MLQLYGAALLLRNHFPVSHAAQPDASWLHVSYTLCSSPLWAQALLLPSCLLLQVMSDLPASITMEGVSDCITHASKFELWLADDTRSAWALLQPCHVNAQRSHCAL